jgi:aspartyl protease family protein
MSVSSGTSSLFASVAFFIAAAAGTAYGLKNKDDVKRFMVEVAGVDLNKILASERGQPSERDAQASDSASEFGDVTLRATDNGHFETTAEINGRDVEVMVDTGATLVALTYEDAERAGIYLKPGDFTRGVATANGITKVAPIEISSVSIGSITVRNIQGAVMERGKLNRTLLGMSFLGKLSRVEMRKNALVLHE